MGRQLPPVRRAGPPYGEHRQRQSRCDRGQAGRQQGSGDVAARNYRTIAALAARRKDIGREGIDAFVAERGMPGYAPTQGHLASAICYLPHALTRLTAGEAERVLLLAKGSLFLGRMSQRSDGMSVLLERNGG